MACDSPSLDTNSLGTSSADSGKSGGVYKSRYCVGDDVVDASDDIYVMINAFSRVKETPPSIELKVENLEKYPEGLADTLLYGQFTVSAVSVNLKMALGPIMIPALSTMGSIMGMAKDDVKITRNETSDTLTIEALVKSDGSTSFDRKLFSYTSDIFPYWNGSFTMYTLPEEGAASVDSTMTWRRDSSTKYFNSTSSNGETMAVSENSDCSGTLSTKTINKRDGSITTMNGLWKITGVTTTGEVTRCEDECYSLSW